MRLEQKYRRISRIVEVTACWVYLINITMVFGTPVVKAVAGGRALLPCNLTSPAPEDVITLILWYREDTKVPIYSLDARKGPIEKARHFPSAPYATRMEFDVNAKPPSLKIEPVRVEDEGVYKCRTEYRRSRTLSLSIKLSIIVAPRETIIMDERGQRLHDIIGPYDEGRNLSLACEAEGGKPSPVVTWWRDSLLLDDSYFYTSQGFVRNDIVIPNLQRSDLMAVFTCQASNTNLTVPTSSSVTLDLNLKPLEIRITTHPHPLSAGRRSQLDCESSGSRPRAVMSWWRGKKKIHSGKDVVSDNGNLTVTTLTFVPTPEDNGKRLTCRADNPALPNSSIEESRVITVHYIPQLRLALGANIQHTAIKEGSDVYFDCNIRANPWVADMGWLFEGRPLYSNTSAGIIVSNQSLVLQRVRKEHRGRYQCVASNIEGEGRSEEVNLEVQFAPVCKHIQGSVHGVARYESINVTCEVEADPKDVAFRWSLNNSVENIDIQHFVTNGTVSTVTYTPRTMLGYGVLTCLARNNIGIQREPCAVRVIPAGPPETIRNCIVTNQTTNSITVECDAGYDGGLSQHFHLEVYNSAVEHLHANLTTLDAPVFTVGGLPSGTSFILVLYAANAKGRSNSVALLSGTLLPAERRTADHDNAPVSPILGVLIGIVTALVLVAIIIVVVMRWQARTLDKEKRAPPPEQIKKCDMPLKQYKEESIDNTIDSPDVIPAKNDTQVYITDGKTGIIDPTSLRLSEISTESLKSKELPCENIVSVQAKRYAKDHLFPDCSTAATTL